MKYEIGDTLRVYNCFEWYTFELVDITNGEYDFDVTPDRHSSSHIEHWSQEKINNALKEGWKFEKKLTKNQQVIKENYNI